MWFKHSQSRSEDTHPLKSIMHDRLNLLINIVVGVLGAFLAGYFLSPIFQVGTINSAITIQTMLLTLAGAVILLFIVNLFRRGRSRN